MLLRGPGSERWDVLEELLEQLHVHMSALTCAAWLAYAWPIEDERGLVLDAIWRALDAHDADAAKMFGWVTRACDAASERALSLGHRLHPHALGHLCAGLLWVCRVGEARFERASLEIVDGVSLPERFVPSHPVRRGANDVTSIRLELLAGEVHMGVIESHEPGLWIARATVAPGRAGGVFKTYSGEQVLAHLRQRGWRDDAQDARERS